LKVISVGSSPAFYQEVTEALRARPEDVNWVQSVESFGSRLAELRERTELVVVSPEIDTENALEIARAVSSTAPTTATVLVRKNGLNGAMSAAMRAGVRDVVDLSDERHDLRASLEQALAWAGTVRTSTNGHRKQRGSVVSVFSSKGGAGKTFLASNLAVAASQMMDEDVALVDLELGIGDVFSYFGMEAQRSFQDLLALGQDADAETTLRIGSRLGTNLVGFGSPPDPSTQAVAGEEIARAIATLSENFRLVIVDLAPDYSDATLAALDASEIICLITQLDVVGVKHLAKGLETLLSIGVPRDKCRIVLNRADSKVGIEPSDVESVLKVKVDALIPSSRLVPAALNTGRPVLLEDPKSEVARAIQSFGRDLFGEMVEQPERGSKRRLFRRS